MKCFRLRSYDNTPPGGFPFKQVEGIAKDFRSVPVIEDQARSVAAFRAANGIARSSFREALEDVDHYQCQRLGNMASFCVSCEADTTAVALSPTSPALAAPCHGCGAPVV